MKLRRLLLSVLVSGVSLGSAAAQQPITDPAGASGSASRNASRSIRDEGPSSVSEGYHLAGHAPTASQAALAPAATSYQPQQMTYGSRGDGSGNYAVGSCGSGACGAGVYGGDLCGSCCDNSPGMWFDAETLLWWGQERNAPPLLATAAAGVAPIPGNAGVTTVVGGTDNGIDNGLLPGYRLSSGMYFGPDQSYGLSGRIFGIYRNTDTVSRSADSTGSSVGLPYFSPLLGAPTSYNVVLLPTLGAVGSASVTSRLDLVSTDSSLRFLVSRAQDHRVELLGGYTYLRLRDSLGIASRQEDTITGNGINDGTVTTTTDTFAAENRFNGAHLGLQSTFSRRRVSLTTMSRVSFGNMNQSGLIAGGTVIDDPVLGQSVQPGGVYAQTSNIGNFERDTFAFIPELGIKGGLALRKNVSLTAGYTFLYISQAALAANQIDPNVDLTQRLGIPSNQPAFSYREGSMWFQGIDLGLNWTF